MQNESKCIQRKDFRHSDVPLLIDDLEPITNLFTDKSYFCLHHILETLKLCKVILVWNLNPEVLILNKNQKIFWASQIVHEFVTTFCILFQYNYKSSIFIKEKFYQAFILTKKASTGKRYWDQRDKFNRCTLCFYTNMQQIGLECIITFGSNFHASIMTKKQILSINLPKRDVCWLIRYSTSYFKIRCQFVS